MGIQNKEVYQEVYPFATENIGAYFKELDFNEKTVLTVGSSLDQAFNALLLGAKHITVYDLNKNTENYYKLKKEAIATTKRTDLYKKLTNQSQIKLTKDYFPESISQRINPYLQDDELYRKLQEKLAEDRISFVFGDIFEMGTALGNEKFDNIILSNILQFLDYFAKMKNRDSKELLQTSFSDWKSHLNNNGTLQLLYLYSFTKNDLTKHHTIPTYNLKEIVQTLKGNSLDISFFSGCQQEDIDAIVTYTKKR